jgi:hypothetical protein
MTLRERRSHAPFTADVNPVSNFLAILAVQLFFYILVEAWRFNI